MRLRKDHLSAFKAVSSGITRHLDLFKVSKDDLTVVNEKKVLKQADFAAYHAIDVAVFDQ